MRAGAHRRVAVLRGAIASLLFALLLAVPGIASGAAPPPIRISYGSPWSQGAIWYRGQMWISVRGLMQPILSPYQNIAVIYYNPNYPKPGPLIGVARESSAAELGPGYHSEEVLKALMEEEGIKPKSVKDWFSEFAPCGPESHDCQTTMGEIAPGAQGYYSFEYGPTAADREIGPHANAIKRLYTQQRRAKNLVNPCSTGDIQTGGPTQYRARSRSSIDDTEADCPAGEEPEPEDDPLADELSNPAEALDPGGIDFTSLQLSYVSLGGAHKADVQYAMNSDGAPVTTNSNTGLNTAQEDSNAFFTWLTLSPKSFWVNLEPNSPPRIIDPTFALTDAGRVLLQSDLLLKEAMEQAQTPATSAGAQYFQGIANLQPLVTAADQTPCVGYRIWIVPGVATVHATKTQLYILSAPLTVKLAVVTHLPGQVLHPLCPQDAFYTGEEALMRQLLLPEVIQEVNTAPQFEPLRRVYMSRVAAQWARQEAGRRTPLGRLVNSGLHRNQLARPRWSPDAVWEQYLQQLDAPPTPVTVPITQNGATVNWTFQVYGGVDFTHKIRMANTGKREFNTRWPGLAAAARRAVKRPSTADGTTLVGGGTTFTHARRSKRVRALRIPRSVIPPTP